MLSLTVPKAEIEGAVDATFVNALCVPKEAVPNAFGIVFRLAKTDCAGATDGCEGGSAVPGVKKADCVGFGPKVSVSH